MQEESWKIPLVRNSLGAHWGCPGSFGEAHLEYSLFVTSHKDVLLPDGSGQAAPLNRTVRKARCSRTGERPTTKELDRKHQNPDIAGGSVECLALWMLAHTSLLIHEAAKPCPNASRPPWVDERGRAGEAGTSEIKAIWPSS